MNEYTLLYEASSVKGEMQRRFHAELIHQIVKVATPEVKLAAWQCALEVVQLEYSNIREVMGWEDR